MTDITQHRALNAAKTASTVVVNRGIGPLGILGVIFVLLKLFEVTAVATWSWWLVLLPFWLPYAIVLGIWGIILAVLLVGAIGVGIFLGAAWLWDSWKYRKVRASLKSYGINRR